MMNHSNPYFRIYSVAKNGDDEEDDKEKDVQCKDANGYPIEPGGIVG